jgi:hypothetical protein
MYMQVGGGVNGSGLYPYGVINPFDIDPNQDNGPFGNPIAPGPASATPAAPPAAPAFADSGLYPYGVTNPFDMDPYELQRRNAGQNKPTPPSVTPPVSSIADKLKLPAINTDPVASMAKASALDAKAKLVASFNIKPKTQTTWGSNIGAANALIGGMSIFSSIAEAANNNRTANQNRFRNWGDAIGPMVSANRGSYTTNEGFLFPNQKTPVQFAARPAIAQMGGGYYSEPTNLEPIPMGPLPEIPSAPPVDMAPPANNSHAGMDDHSNFKMPNVTVNQRVKPNEAAWQAYDYYVNEKGLEPHVAAGIIGNLYQESGLKPQVKERARPELEQQGYTAQGMGIAQWSANGRYKTLLAYADKNKRDPNDLYTQLDFILDEPGEGAKALKALAKTSTPEEASYVFGKIYERPMDKYAGWDVRAGIARKLFEGNLPNKNDVAKQDHSPAAHQGNYQQGGEYIVSPKQLEFILANGGEVEYL